MLCCKHFFCINTVELLPCEQRLHFRCVSWRAKSILCRHPFKSVQKFGRINLKNGFFPVVDRFRALRESCVNLAQQMRVNAIFLFPRNLRHLTTDLTINFACEIARRISRMHDRKLNGCQQRLLFARQLLQRKCSLCSQGIKVQD